MKTTTPSWPVGDDSFPQSSFTHPLARQPGPASAVQTADTGSTYSGVRLAFSVRETARILGVSEKTVRRLVNRKLLRASRALRHLLIPAKEIQRFLDETTLP